MSGGYRLEPVAQISHRERQLLTEAAEPSANIVDHNFGNVEEIQGRC